MTGHNHLTTAAVSVPQSYWLNVNKENIEQYLTIDGMKFDPCCRSRKMGQLVVVQNDFASFVGEVKRGFDFRLDKARNAIRVFVLESDKI